MGTGTDAGNAPGAMGGRMGGEPTTAIGISVRSLAAASGAPALPSGAAPGRRVPEGRRTNARQRLPDAHSCAGGARRELRSVSLAPRCSRFVR